MSDYLPLLPAWISDAPCASIDPVIFFPTTGDSLKPAKDICATCPVQTQCLADALALPQEADNFGVFGGLSAGERRQLRKGRAA